MKVNILLIKNGDGGLKATSGNEEKYSWIQMQHNFLEVYMWYPYVAPLSKMQIQIPYLLACWAKFFVAFKNTSMQLRILVTPLTSSPAIDKSSVSNNLMSGL